MAFNPPYPTAVDKFSGLSDIFDLMLDALCVVDQDGQFVFVNAAFTRIFGYKAEEIIGTSMSALIFVLDRERTANKVKDILGGERTTLFENRWMCKDGRVVDVMWSAQWSEQYQVRIAIGRDMTEYKQGQSEQVAIYSISEAAYTSADLTQLLQRVHHFISEWIPSANFLVALVDRENNAVSFPYAVAMFDHDIEACRAAAEPLIESVMATGEMQVSIAGEICSIGGGTPLSRHSMAIPLRVDNESIGALIVQKSYTGTAYGSKQIELLQFAALQIAGFIQRKHMEAQLHFMAGHDALTRLPNRSLFLDRFKIALGLSRRHDSLLALLFVDLNGFKGINDRHGHLCGDAILSECARRLEKCIRVSDTVTRFGGDEFVVLLHTSSLKIEDIISITEKISQTIREPMAFDGVSISVTASIGVSHYPEHGETLEELMNHADKAMYVAKRTS